MNLEDCPYYGNIDFTQDPPYLQYDTGDSTAKENWGVFCDIQDELRRYGFELTETYVDHDTVCGDVTPMDQNSLH